MNNTYNMDKSEYEKRLAKQSNARRHQKRRRRRKSFVSVFLVLASLIICTFICAIVFFKIDEVVINTSDLITYDEALELSKINLSENILRINENQIKDDILNSVVTADDVVITKKYPTKVFIDIVKADIEFCFKQDTGYFLISKNGRVIEKVLSCPEGVLLINGIKQSLTIGQFINTTNEQFAEVKLTYDAFIQNGLEKITIIDVNDQYNINVFYNNKVRMILGNENNLSYKVKVVKQAYTSDFSENEYGVIDGSVERNAYVRKGKDYITYFDDDDLLEQSTEPDLSEQSSKPNESGVITDNSQNGTENSSSSDNSKP